jgi:tRNA(Arg) A34 adenosine deaminase TadA
MDIVRRSLLGVGTLAAIVGASRKGQAAEPIVQPDGPAPLAFIQRAFELREQASLSGDQAYGAVIIKDGRIVGEAQSRVVLDNDPTAHAEMTAIRDAARRLGTRDLASCIMYSSSKPCPMCEAAAYWAGITRLHYGRNGADGGRPKACG